MSVEVWKLIPGFPAYRVSPNGSIESRWRTGPFYNGFEIPDVWKRIQLNQRPDGYMGIDLRDGYGRNRKTYVHILVAESFICPKPFPRACVRHLDGNPENNAVSNLAWGTYKENEDDKRRHGTWETRSTGKLAIEQRNAIRARALAGESQRSLATEFGVSRPTVTRLVNQTTWAGDDN